MALPAPQPHYLAACQVLLRLDLGEPGWSPLPCLEEMSQTGRRRERPAHVVAGIVVPP